MLTFWIIIALMVLSVVAMVWSEHSNRGGDWIIGIGIFIIILGFIVALALGLSMVTSVPEEIAVFKLQKEYIEQRQDLDSAILGLEKVKQNQWLFEVQTKVERYGLFSVYPKSVLELQPIQ